MASSKKLTCVYDDTNAKHAPPHEFYASTGWETHVEKPVRTKQILKSLQQTFADELHVVAPRNENYTEDHILAAHDKAYFAWLKTAWINYEAFRKSRFNDTGALTHGLIPDVFTFGARRKLPACASLGAGHYCFDTYTPIMPATYETAVHSGANVALTAADIMHEKVQEKQPNAPSAAVYALCRPPGHHAGPDYYGGYCYLNNVAIAAKHLQTLGYKRISILDVDYHHGNGTQDIFFEDASVQYVSIHGDPDSEFPYFSGHATESRDNQQLLNIPLPPFSGEEMYQEALGVAVAAITKFDPHVLLVSLGVDTQMGDPMGTFKLQAPMYEGIGRTIRHPFAHLPTLIVQEGGYLPETMGECVAQFLKPFVNE